MTKIKNLAEGMNTIFLMVREISERTSKNGKPYITLTLTDGSDTIGANMWDATGAQFPVKVGGIAALKLNGQPYNGRISYTIYDVREASASDGVTQSMFVKTAPVSPEKLYDKCMDYIENEMDDPDYQLLCRTIYEENKGQLLHASAAKSVHHYAIGELLWHVTRMAATALQIASIYKLDKNVLLAGVLLHDIGKLEELHTDVMGSTTYTEDGSLFGHLMLGAEMINSYGERLEIPGNKLRVIRHIIVSHHGTREYGAITLPATAEAYAVHVIDLLDSRIYIYDAESEKLEPGTFSDRIGVLDGINIWKPGN